MFRAFLLVVLLWWPVLANAQTWTSIDGFLSVSPPDAETFNEDLSAPPPFDVVWESKDGSMRFSVVREMVPRGINLRRDIIEEMMAEQLGGHLTRSTKRVAGHEVWVMKVEGKEVTTTWAIVRHDRIVYKLIMETDSDHSDSEFVDRFIDSLSFAEPPHPESDTVDDTARGETVDAARRAAAHIQLVMFGGIVAFALVVFVVARRKIKRES